MNAKEKARLARALEAAHDGRCGGLCGADCPECHGRPPGINRPWEPLWGPRGEGWSSWLPRSAVLRARRAGVPLPSRCQLQRDPMLRVWEPARGGGLNSWPLTPERRRILALELGW